MNSFEKLLDSCYDSYVNYHRLQEANLHYIIIICKVAFYYKLSAMTLFRYLPPSDLSQIKCMSLDERQLFSKEVSLFVASITSEIQSLNHQVDLLSENATYHSIAAGDHAESSQVTFYKLILSSLLTVSLHSNYDILPYDIT